jgi:hypothetical protein
MRVDPTRLELVTSAMRGRYDTFAGVRTRSEIGLSKPIQCYLSSQSFVAFLVGNCRVTVIGYRDTPQICDDETSAIFAASPVLR